MKKPPLAGSNGTVAIAMSCKERSFRLTHLAIGLCACLIAISSPLLGVGAKKSPSKMSEPVKETVTVTEVQVPVTVFDQEGLPIRGLALEDFELIDNGRRQQILSLETIDLDALEPVGTRVEIERAVPAAARRYFLLLFDHTFSSPGSIRGAQEASRRFVIDFLHPTDLAAVAVLTADAGPRLVVTFTPDRAQVARGIDAVATPQLLQMAKGQDPLKFLIEAPTTSGGTTAISSDWTIQSEYFESGRAEQQGYLDVINQQMGNVERSFNRGQVEGWSAAMGRLAKALNSLRGRKYVIYLSEGFNSQLLYGEASANVASVAGRELTPIEQNLAGVLDSEELYGSVGVRNSVDEMLREFQRSDCIIEAVDISSSESSSNGGASLGSEGSLFYLASKTGGEAHRAGRRLEERLDVMLRRSAVTYLMTFHPSRLKQDGGYHRLKVKADLPTGAKLTHRAGYYAPRPFDELHPVEKDLLIADAIAGATPSREVGIRLLAAPFPAGDSIAYVPVILEIAGESLIVGHEDEHLPIEIYAYVSDEYGEMNDFFTHVLTFDLAGRWEVFRQTGLKYYGHLDLDVGRDYLLRVVVRNAKTGRTGVETLALTVPDFSTHEPVLLPPFFVEPSRRWFMVREQPSEQLEQEWMVYPFTIKGEPFVPAVVPLVQRDEEIELCLIAYNLGVETPELAGSVLVNGVVMEGGSFDITDHIIASQSGVDKLVVRFRPAGLGPGDYELRLALRDPSWGEAILQQVPFVVVD